MKASRINDSSYLFDGDVGVAPQAGYISVVVFIRENETCIKTGR